MANQMKGEDPCWKGFEMVGMKKKDGKEVPNCVPKAKEAKAKARSYRESRQSKGR
jgi:hypothetical protein